MQDLWDDVRLQLRCHLLIRLSSRSSEQPVPSKILSLSVSESVHCLQLLFFLYPEFEVLTHYQVMEKPCERQFKIFFFKTQILCFTIGIDQLYMIIYNHYF